MKEKIKAYLELSRPLNCLMGGVAVIIGSLVEGATFSYLPSVIVASLAAFFIIAGGNAINDYFDWKVDLVAHPKRPIPSGRLSLSETSIFALMSFLLGLGLAFFVNWICFLIALISVAVLISYEKGLKERGFIGNLAISYLVGSLFLFGGASIGVIYNTAFLALLAFLANLGREMIKDVEDLEGDKGERKTLPITRGAERTLLFSSVFLLAAIIFSFYPWIQGIFGREYFLVVLLADVAFLISIFASFKNAKKAKNIVKLGMIIALISFLIGGIV